MGEREFIKNEIGRLGNSIFALLPLYDEKDYEAMVRLAKRISNVMQDILTIYEHDPSTEDKLIINLITDVTLFVGKVINDTASLKKKFVRDSVLKLRHRVANLNNNKSKE